MSDTPNPNFTFCEVRIISLIKQGLSNKEIANELSIEVTAVKTYKILLKSYLGRIALQSLN
jgi:DNA-binding NarL/FixJ family response regulator